MKRLKTQKGITLVALVITIIVLLILAVVAIGAVQDSKIIGHSQDAAERYNTGKATENSMLVQYENAISKYETGGNFVTNGEGSGENIENGGNQGGGTTNPPTENPDPEPEPEQPEEPDFDPDPEFNEYTLWTEGKSSNQTFGGATTGSSSNPIIPAGFMPVNTKNAKWDVEGGPQWDNGLVITDGNSEFVWVPVTGDISTTEYTVTEGNITYREPEVVTGNGNEYDAVATNLQRAECTENPEDSDEVLTSEDFKAELTKMYKAMADSVNTYDGFYVGRYETSKNGTNPQSKYGATTAYNTENDWYGLYALNKKYTTSSVQGSMMWGIQYDKMMDWMGNDATNFDENTRNNNDEQRRTGYVSTDVIRNVYDIGGNSNEWILEACSTNCRAARGRLLLEDRWFTKISLRQQSGLDPQLQR